MTIIVGIAIGLLAIAALLVVITVRWLHVLIDSWQRIALHHCGGVLSILPQTDSQGSSPPRSDAAPDQVTDTKLHP